MDNNKRISYKELIPYLGSVIVFLGVTRLIFYYGNFGITITDYVEFTEILTSFLSVLVITIIFFAFSVVQTFLQTSKSDNESQKQLNQRIISEEKFIKRFALYFKYFDRIIFNLVGLCIVFLGLGILEKNLRLNTFLVLLLMFVVFFFLAIVFKEVEVKHEQMKSSKDERMLSSLILTALLFIILTLWFTYDEVNSVKKLKSTYGTTVTLTNDTVIKSDSCNYFIGKTKNYVFFYNEQYKTSDIIPISEIKRIKIKKNELPKNRLLGQ